MVWLLTALLTPAGGVVRTTPSVGKKASLTFKSAEKSFDEVFILF